MDDPRPADERTAAVEAGLRAYIVRAGFDDEMAERFTDAMRSIVWLLARVIESIPEAPNFITWSYETPGASYEVTIRQHGGMTPIAKIAALNEEIARLRARLAEVER